MKKHVLSSSLARWVRRLASFGALAATSLAAEIHDLTTVAIVAPRHVTLTAEHSTRTKPVIVFIENRGTRAETIADAASLAKLVTLRVEPAGEGMGLTPELVVPANFPIVLRPGRKLPVVFTVRFDRASAPAPGLADFSYSATVNLDPSDARPANDGFPRGDDVVLTDVILAPSFPGSIATGGMWDPTSGSAATVSTLTRRSRTRAVHSVRQAVFQRLTATPMKVPIRKGQTLSDPIDFKAIFTGGPRCFVSWDDGDAAESIESGGFRNDKLRAKWSMAGDHVVEAYVYDLDDPDFGNAPHKAVTIQVIKVHFEDEMGNDPNGMKLGVTTFSKDRRRTLKAIVEPASEMDNVELKIAKGGSNMTFVSSPVRSGGTITFEIQGVGTTGSSAKNDCTIEATISGKPAASADVTVVVPKKIFSQNIGAYGSNNELANEGTSPAFQGVPKFLGVLLTRYGWTVTVNVRDQFGDAIGDSKLYLDAPVFEAFRRGGGGGRIQFDTATPINRKVLTNSSYLDPVGASFWKNFPASPPRVLYLDPRNSAHTGSATPAFPLPSVASDQSRTDTFQVQVDGFPLDPPITRTLTLHPGQILELTQTP